MSFIDHSVIDQIALSTEQYFTVGTEFDSVDALYEYASKFSKIHGFEFVRGSKKIIVTVVLRRNPK